MRTITLVFLLSLSLTAFTCDLTTTTDSTREKQTTDRTEKRMIPSGEFKPKSLCAGLRNTHLKACLEKEAGNV